MPPVLQLLPTSLPVTAVAVAGIVAAALMVRRQTLAALLAVAGCLAWLGQGALVVAGWAAAGALTPLVEDGVFALGMALVLAAAVAGARGRSERR